MTIQIFLLEDLLPHSFPNYRTLAVNIKGKESQMLGFCLIQQSAHTDTAISVRSRPLCRTSEVTALPKMWRN